jgi:hypothetical protein
MDGVTGALLVIEVKTVVPDVGGMLETLDRKVRLARELADARLARPNRRPITRRA